MPAFQYLGGAHGRGLLESALAAPQQIFAGRYLHRTIFDKAAALFRSLVKNHCLVDGNKRLALTTATVFLTLNEHIFYAPREEAVEFTLRIASAEGNVDLRYISKWFRRNSFKVFDVYSFQRNKKGVISITPKESGPIPKERLEDVNHFVAILFKSSL